MPPDPLTNPIAALTDHPVLACDVETALITTMHAGTATRATLHSAQAAGDPTIAHQITQSDDARATRACHNLRLVVNIARRYQRVAGDHLSLEDLIGFGTIGLLQAIDKFDPRKAGKLSTYATWWVRQAISRGITQEGRVINLPVHMHEHLSRYRHARNRLIQHLGREPSPEELATNLGYQPQRIAQLEQIGREVLSLNAQIYADDDRTELGDSVPAPGFDPEEAALASALRRDVATAMARQLSEREQRFLRTYFGFDTGERATLEAIGSTEGLTRERVRQVIAEAVEKLRQDPTIRAYGEKA